MSVPVKRTFFLLIANGDAVKFLLWRENSSNENVSNKTAPLGKFSTRLNRTI